MNNPDDSATFGQRGVVTRTGTAPLVGSFYAIQAITETTFTALSENLGEGDTMTGIAIPAGTTIFGRFTSLTASSGNTFRAYKH